MIPLPVGATESPEEPQEEVLGGRSPAIVFEFSRGQMLRVVGQRRLQRRAPPLDLFQRPASVESVLQSPNEVHPLRPSCHPLILPAVQALEEERRAAHILQATPADAPGFAAIHQLSVGN